MKAIRQHAYGGPPLLRYEDALKSRKAGDTFYEPTGSVHRLARNPSAKIRTRLLAVILHARDAKDVTIPEQNKE